MNIYSKKQRWKLLLLLGAVIIVVGSLLYSNRIVNRISNEERKKVELWSIEIKKKAQMVNYTARLFDELREEERKKVRQWVEAIKRLTDADFKSDLAFLSQIVQDNTTVPVILTDGDLNVLASRNLDSMVVSPDDFRAEILRMKAIYDPIEINYYEDQKNYLYYKDSRLLSELENTFRDLEQSFISEVVKNAASVPVVYLGPDKKEVIDYGNIDQSLIADPVQLTQLIEEMSDENAPIEVELQEGQMHFIVYQESWILTQLRYYPYVQFGLMAIFILIAYLLFSTARKAEQDQVWLGMAKETAHQLGTPLSSLMAWREVMAARGVDQSLLDELDKDIGRFETITERFSKIGSQPELANLDLVEATTSSFNYMKSRSPKKVEFALLHPGKGIMVRLNLALYAWVIENVIRNAMDAMDGNGKITVTCWEEVNLLGVDIADTGKGITQGKRKTVFEPGYTTKKRGWGLGLSLSKRIIEHYHVGGKIFVLKSKPGEGSTFRIQFPKA